METIKITTREQKAIKSLERVAKNWPKSLQLFSWSGTLVVFKKLENGLWAQVDSIPGIPNDGGDPDYGSEVEFEDNFDIEWE